LWRYRDGEVAEIWRGSQTALLEPAAVSPDGEWIVTGGSADGVRGLFKIPVDGGNPERIAEGEAMNPVWSPDGNLIVYAGVQVNVNTRLLAIRPDGESVYMLGRGPSQDFWLLDLATMASRQLTELDPTATMRTFDITPDGRQIVFDRLSLDSDIVLIER